MNTSVDPSTQHVQFPITFTNRSRATDAYTVQSYEDDPLDDSAPPTRTPTSARRYAAPPYQQSRPTQPLG